MVLLAHLVLSLLLCDICGSSAAAAANSPEQERGHEESEHAAEDPIFIFATIGDTHIRANRIDDYRHLKAMAIAPELLAVCVADINRHDPSVDFVVQLGDLTDLGKPGEFEIAKAILNGLRCPLYAIAGNHDNYLDNDLRLWKKFAGKDFPNYAFDWGGLHFIAIDCTMDPYEPPYVECTKSLIEVVAKDLLVNYDRPTILLSHYNLVPRYWDEQFSLDRVAYCEYLGVRRLRHVLECAGNVLAVINGHVHANRVEIHNGIHYIDVGATLIGPPSIRYFHVFEDEIRVDYEYISDPQLLGYVTAMCEKCRGCFDADQVCEFINGEETDKRFSIPIRIPTWSELGPDGSPIPFDVDVAVESGRVEVGIDCELCGPLELSFHDRTGMAIGRFAFIKLEPRIVVHAGMKLRELGYLPGGTYYARVCMDGQSRTRRFSVCGD